MQVFTGRKAPNPLALALAPTALIPVEYSFAQAQKAAQADELQSRVAEIHKAAAQARTRSRQVAIERDNAKTHVNKANFSVGDFVLVAVPKKERRHKMMAIWRGPRRDFKLDSSMVLEVDNLVKGTHSLVHISHVKLYSDADLGREVELQAVAEQVEHAVFTIRKLLDLRYEASKTEWQVLCAWRGYSDEESTWEPVCTLKWTLRTFSRSFLPSTKIKSLSLGVEPNDWALFWLAVLYIVVRLTLADSKAVLLAYYASLRLFSCSYFTYSLRSAVAQPNLLARRSRPLMSWVTYTQARPRLNLVRL
jgi:Chromo (CHRromatin Organisation MOdifier) domain